MEKIRTDVRLTEGCLIFLLAIAANLGMQFLLSVAAMIFGQSTAESDYFQIVGMFLLQLSFLAVPLLYYTCKKRRPRLMAPVRKPSPRDCFAIALPVVSMAAFSLPAMFFGAALEKIGYTTEGISVDTPLKLVLVLIATVLVAPVVEETIFRGFLLGGLRRGFSAPVAALLSGLAFALMHMNPAQTVYQFCLGVVCAMATLYSGNLLTAIFTHAASNLIALFAGDLIARVAAYLWARPALAAFVTVAIAAAGCVLVWLLCMGMKSRRAAEKQADASITTNDAEKQSGEAIAANDDAKQAGESDADRRVGLGLYAGAAALCTVMWIFVLATTILMTAP